MSELTREQIEGILTAGAEVLYDEELKNLCDMALRAHDIRAKTASDSEVYVKRTCAQCKRIIFLPAPPSEGAREIATGSEKK